MAVHDPSDSDLPHVESSPGDHSTGRRRSPFVIAALALLLLAGVVAAVLMVVLNNGGDGNSPTDVATDYLAAWQDGEIDTMEALVAEPPELFREEHDRFTQAMQIEDAQYDVVDVEVDGDDAIARFESALTLTGLGDWAYEGRLRLRRSGEDRTWQIAWTPAALHPLQTEEHHLRVSGEWPERGAITDEAGEPLVTAQPAQLVAIHPALMDDMDDRDEIKDALEEHLDVDPETVDEGLDAPGVEPDHLVPIVTIPQDEYEEVEADIYPVPGLVFRDRTLRLGPTPDFARHVIGRTGEITAERLDDLGSPYQVGDDVGLSGLELQFERELAGTPSGEIQLVDTDGGEVTEVVDTLEGIDPVDLRTTLDRRIQVAVEDAVEDIDKPVGAVVVDTSGNIRAAVSQPSGEFSRALEGTYAPGSTFKVVTAEALLTAGMTPDTEIDCDETITAGGRTFTNFEDADLGSVPFSTAFAQSCNTAMITAGLDLESSDLVDAAERFGFNTEYSLGIPAAGGTFPEPENPTEQAAAVIGQGRTVTSPLHMATVAAAVSDGTWRPPVLLPSPPGDADPEQDDDEDQQPESRDLTSGTGPTILELMELVVTEGSGTPAAVDGARIAGKTGTAEFGSGDPLPTHAWFIGLRGDLAVAVVLEDGGVGGRDAAPVAGEILAALPD